jgi:hypothetical protein
MVELRAFAHDLLGARGVIPKIGIFGKAVKFVEAGYGFVVVKDASSAESAISRCPLWLKVFRRACLFLFRKASVLVAWLALKIKRY